MKRFLVLLMAVIMLAMGANAAFEKVNTYDNNFSDVADTAWYAANVKTAYELGFMNGKAEGKFDPNGNVTVVEGITMASRLHAIYNGTEVKKEDKVVSEYRFDFDDPSIIVDLSERNSRNTNGVNFNRATGKIEDGMLIAQPDAPNANGVYDPQIKFEGLELNAKDYNKVTFRMKVDELDDPNGRNKTVEFFFQTSVAPNIDAEKQINIKFPAGANYSEWFEVEADLGNHELWNEVITGFRFDPSNNNGIYYIDSIVFSKSENIKNDKWYDMYVDYAVENGIIGKTQFKTSEYERNITRAEICVMFANAIPESHFAPINDVKGIPDVFRDSENADIFLTLYKAGVLLGDTNGYFNPESDIKRSEIAAIINRIALPESRVKGTVNSDWSTQGNKYDVEFNDAASLKQVTINKVESTEIVDGALVIKAQDMQDKSPKYDPQITVNDVAISAKDYNKLKVRMKAEFIGEPDNPNAKKFDFYFKTDEDDVLDEKKSIHDFFEGKATQDAFGWYIIEVDFRTHKEWKGNITGFRFDPATANGIYTIDYIRLVKSDPLLNASHEELVAQGYEATYLMQDKGWDNGFYVGHYEQSRTVDMESRIWQYNETDEKPLWEIAPIWNTYDLWEHKVVDGNKYVLTDDKGINTLTYNPEEKSMSMRLNATKIYNGEPHNPETYKWWPHLLLDQKESLPVDKEKNSVNADRMYIELDMRVTDFKDTLNQEGSNVCSFLAYFYLKTDKNPAAKIWYGVRLFPGLSASTSTTPGWAPDSAAHMYMYGITPADIYGGIENSFNPEKGVVAVSDEWKHVRVDITEHIDRCIEWANRDKAYGVEVSKEDLYFNGGNIGFEIHGNYDMTVEIKNVDIVSYNKK